MWLKVGYRMLNLDRFTEIRPIRGSQVLNWGVRLDTEENQTTLPMDSREEAEKFIREIAYAMSKGETLLEMYGDE